MKLNAYILVADPAFVETSVNSYYDWVDTIVVSYDSDDLAWTGAPLDIQPILARLRQLDRKQKLRFVPGRYSHPDRYALLNETDQRQEALDYSGRDADWVLQLDTDEVLGAPQTFLNCLQSADEGGFQGLHYPSRWLYQQVDHFSFLESCSRLWQVTAGYPGAMAVKSGSRLKLARHCEGTLYRVDFKPRNTDPAHAPDTVVHRVVSEDEGIFHFSWIRTDEEMHSKLRSWGHAADFDWSSVVRHWRWARRHPTLAVLSSPWRRRRYRIPFLRRIELPETVRHWCFEAPS